MKATVTRKAHFNSAHRLHVPTWSDEKNRSYFGLCNNPNYHGHNYELEVSVTGDIDPLTGYAYDIGKLKNVIEKEITACFDHKNLNLDTLEFKTLNPTAENIASVIWQKLRKHIESKYELTVTLAETPRNIVTVNGK
ncbi:MAG: 6-carboxytetrahydropterin synthase [Bacteroidetes bacterium]|nr:6-carboxytetrahydropterin synthase [Bacteroidota bacterium]